MTNDSGINLVQIITAFVAVYGALLSTYTLISKHKENKRQIKVNLTGGFLISGPNLSKPMFLLNASNHGHRSVMLTSVGLLLSNKKQIVFPVPQSNVSFPHDLLEGKSCTVWIEYEIITQELKKEGFSKKVKLIGFFRDAMDTIHKSKPVKFNLDEQSI